MTKNYMVSFEYDKCHQKHCKGALGSGERRQVSAQCWIGGSLFYHLQSFEKKGFNGTFIHFLILCAVIRYHQLVISYHPDN